jgi:hypothetical protein
MGRLGAKGVVGKVGLRHDKKDEAPRLVSAGVSGIRVDDAIFKGQESG